MERVNFLLVGVGGQGTLLASNVLGEAGLLSGHDVKKSEIHGMAQRGGSVSSHVRWGDAVLSPMSGKGEVDILIGFEKLESIRHIDYLKQGGKAILSTHQVPPVSVTSGGAEYPGDARWEGIIAQVTKDVLLVPAVEIARELGDARTHNVVMLGALSTRLTVDEMLWLEAIERYVPARALEINRRAFTRGREVGRTE